MYDAILVPTDARPRMAGVVDRALNLAETVGASVHALSVVDPGRELQAVPEENREAWREAAETAGREAVDWITDRAEDRGLAADGEVREGRPYREILAYTEEAGIDLAVMATHSEPGADWPRVGSTTERVITAGDVPVLVVGPTDDVEAGEDGFADVVLPTDGSGTAERAVKHGIDLAGVYGATVHAVYVVDRAVTDYADAPGSIVGLLKEGGRGAVEDVAELAREADLGVETRILRGTPHAAVVQYAVGADADLIVVGTRGAAAGSDRLLGSTTARILRRSPIPVLVA